MKQHTHAPMPSCTLNGISLSNGRGQGHIWHAHGGLPRRFKQQVTIQDSMIASEIGRMRQAVQIVSLVMENSIYQVTARLGKTYADMFVALREILHDVSIIEALQDQIEKQCFNAETSIKTTFELFRKRISESSNLYMRERAVDLLELQGSLLDALVSAKGPSETSDAPNNAAGSNAIAVVETLTPRLVLDLNNTNVSGIACEHAGPTSHAAILCRAFQIPAIAGIKHIHKQLPQGCHGIVDGTSGTIEFVAKCGVLPERKPQTNTPNIADNTGIDTSQITLMANLNLSQNAISALAAGAQGIGLYRTEFEFMLNNKLLTKQEQFIRYRTVVIAMMGLPVTIRILDVAVDKADNIAALLGSRVTSSCYGALFLLSWPEVLETQAAAIAEAAEFGPVRVVYPMVADTQQFLALKKIFTNAVGQQLSGKLLHGAMIELPSAVEDSKGILQEADFACLGTNDLITHLLHVDRQTAIAKNAKTIQAPVLWEAIGRVAESALSSGKELTVCGEMASNVSVLPRFIELGIRTFSMDIHMIRMLRKGLSN